MSDYPADQAQGATLRSTQVLPADFVETSTPEISVPELLARVQEEVARRKSAAVIQNSSEPSAVSFLGTGKRSRSCLDYGLITANLHLAEKNALVGKHVPELKRFPGPLRIVSRLLAGVILYPLRLITNPQREFNQATLIALWALRDGVRQLEKAYQQARANLVERHLQEMMTSLKEQERRLDLVLDESRRKAG